MRLHAPASKTWSLARRSLARMGTGVALAAAASLWLIPHTRAAETLVPPPALDEAATAPSETVILAGGCFWGVQGVFQHVKGVTRAVAGYSGGSKADPSYEEVSLGTSGHAESVEVTFDPHVVSFGEILRIFFSVAHDPTELNRQGPDRGTQYRSAIFWESPAQQKVAAAYAGELDAKHVFPDKVVTQIAAAKAFYPAEDYHQDYATLHPDRGYIAINDLPKIDALKRLFPHDWRDKPVLVKTAAAD